MSIRHATSEKSAKGKKPAAVRPGRISSKAAKPIPSGRTPGHGVEMSRALTELKDRGRVSGSRSRKISARVDPAILSAAAERLGLPDSEISEVVNASLALTAAPDKFKDWLRNSTSTLPDDFELAI